MSLKTLIDRVADSNPQLAEEIKNEMAHLVKMALLDIEGLLNASELNITRTSSNFIGSVEPLVKVLAALSGKTQVHVILNIRYGDLEDKDLEEIMLEEIPDWVELTDG